MDPERFARLKEVLLSARRLPLERRDAYLDEMSGDDAEFRAELDAILGQDSVSIEALRSLHIDSIVEAIEASGNRQVIPERIGPYRIAGVLGEGGMGVVFRAEQTEPIRREVALKVMRPGFDSHRVQSRFEGERQTLALMDHPHIARLLDAATDEHGSPYFVMELVRGMPITDYCRDNGVRLQRRLGLFVDICRAVQHAHQKGVIHRDLKPSNLLIAVHQGEPIPKVIDFGIAKAMDSGDALPGLTQDGQLMGTLEYMSPEQARGTPGAVDTRSDVYSLGVVLHEMVTGKLPYRVRNLPIPEAIRVICDEAPTLTLRTSTSGRLDTDLATIIRKALEKDAGRRYQSTADLADDLDRYLRSEPVLARPSTRTYQFRMLVSRHKAAFATVAGFTILTLAFAITMAFMYGVQTRERKRAEREAQRATRTNEFMQELLTGSAPNQKGREVTVREMLENAHQKLAASPIEEPEIECAVRVSLGDTYYALGRQKEAEAEYRLALSALDRAEGDVTVQRLSILESLVGSLYYQDRIAAAESLLVEALEVAGPRQDLQTTDFLNNLGMVRMRRGDYAGAEANIRESISISRRILGDRFVHHALRVSNLAFVVEAQGRLDESEILFREALVRAREWGEDMGIRWQMEKLGIFLATRGDYVEAESLLAHAFRMGELRWAVETIPEAAWTRVQLGILRRRQGAYVEAESLLQQAVFVQEKLQPQDEHVVGALHHLGGVLTAERRFIEAGTVHSRALAEAQSRGHANDELGAIGLLGLADLRRAEGRADEAEALLRQALDVPVRVFTQNGLAIAPPLLEMGMFLVEEDRAAEAEAFLRRCLEELVLTGWADEWPAAVARNELACSLAAQGLEGAADSLWVTSRGALVGPTSPVPHEVRRRALEHTIRAHRTRPREPAVTDYTAALARL